MANIGTRLGRVSSQFLVDALVIVRIEENISLHVTVLDQMHTFFDLTVSKHAPSKTTTSWCFCVFSCWPVCETVEDILCRLLRFGTVVWQCCANSVMAQMCRVIVIAVLLVAAVIKEWGGLNGGIAEVWVHGMGIQWGKVVSGT